MKKGGKVGNPGRNSPNVIQSEAKNLDDTHVNVPRSFASLWMTYRIRMPVPVLQRLLSSLFDYWKSLPRNIDKPYTRDDYPSVPS